jgi:hypothetical protein
MCMHIFLSTLIMLRLLVGQTADPPQAPTDAQIKALVDQLASENSARPKDDGKNTPPRPTKEYFEKQRKVDEAARKLVEIGPRAFPFLIDHWNDDRYCMTIGGISVLENHSVGQISRQIVEDQLNLGGFQKEPKGTTIRDRRRPLFDLGEQKQARTWWEKNKKKTLAEMQVDVLDWTIAEEAKISEKISDAERAYLTDLRKRIATTGKAKRTYPPIQSKE